MDSAANAGSLTFGLNVTLDGCCDHREGIADAELHDHFTQLIGGAGAMLYGRKTYELMEAYWPAVVHDEKASRSDREFARTLDNMPKHVVSASRRDFQGVLVGSPMLGGALEKLGLIDEYHLVIHPVLAGHGPKLFDGLERSRHLELVSTKRLTSGVTAMHYRRKA